MRQIENGGYHTDGTARSRCVPVVAWEHNSQVGDARAIIAMGDRGELNVGQLARQRYGGECLLVGLTMFDGTVTAASDWGGPAERKRVRPALAGSHESLLQETGAPRYWLDTAQPVVRDVLAGPRLERAIGVIYQPRTERGSHYFDARLAEQFDVVIHLDHTRAPEPLERTSGWDQGEPHPKHSRAESEGRPRAARCVAAGEMLSVGERIQLRIERQHEK